MKKRAPTPANNLATALMIRALLDGPVTAAEIYEETGYTRDTVRRKLREWHRQGIVYVAEWRVDSINRHSERAFRFGLDKQDAPKIRAARTVIVNRYRSRVRARLQLHRTAGVST